MVQVRVKLQLFASSIDYYMLSLTITYTYLSIYQFNIKRNMYHNLLEGQPKSDIVFYKAFTQDKGNKQSFAGLKTLLLGFMVTLIVKY